MVVPNGGERAEEALARRNPRESRRSPRAIREQAKHRRNLGITPFALLLEHVLGTLRRRRVERKERHELLAALAREVLLDLLPHAGIQHIALLILREHRHLPKSGCTRSGSAPRSSASKYCVFGFV